MVNFVSLFESETEYATFLNLIAHRRINRLITAISLLENDRENAIANCTSILIEYNEDPNCIATLIDIEDKLNISTDDSMDLVSLMQQKSDLESKIIEFLDTLLLTVRENFEFSLNQIIDRSKRILESKQIIDKIKDNYPNVENLDVSKAISECPTLLAIQKYIEPNKDFDKVEEPLVESTITLPYVVRITTAPESLLMKLDNNNTTSTIIDDPSFESHEPFAYSVDDTMFTTASPETTEDISYDNYNFGPLFNENNNLIENNSETSSDETSFNPIEDNNTSSNNLNELLKFPMTDGISLTSVAEAACGNREGWQDIYDANKEIIDELLIDREMSIEEAKDNENIFAGLTLVIPNIYNHVIATN